MESRKIVFHYDVGKFFWEKNMLKISTSASMRSLVLKQILEGKNTDVEMVLGSKSYMVHGHVMRLYSEFLSHRLRTGTVITLPSDKLKASTVQMLCDWMVSDGVDCPRSELLDFLETAHCFFVPRLVDTVFQCLCDSESFSGVDAIHTYFEAKRKNQAVIAELLMSYIRKFFLLLICTDEYRDMDLKCVCSLLSSDKLVVQSEIEVFYAALFWLFVDYAGRKCHLGQLMQCVRFMLLPPRFLLNLGKHLHELPEELADELYPRLHKTMLYQQEEHLKVLQLEDVMLHSRTWIRDPECPYINYEHQRDVTHLDFLAYVDQLNCVKSFLARVHEFNYEKI